MRIIVLHPKMAHLIMRWKPWKLRNKDLGDLEHMCDDAQLAREMAKVHVLFVCLFDTCNSFRPS